MSAFIVEDTTIDKVVTFLRDDSDSEWARRELAEDFKLDIAGTPEDAQLLGAALVAMNTRAVNARYRENEVATAYRYCPATAPTIVALKAMRCLVYQCSEGDVPATPLYKFLDDFSKQVALRLVSRMPAYDAAPWG